MKIDEKELNDIFNALEYCEFGELYDDVFFEQVVAPFKEKYKKSFCYDFGATKGVLIFEKLGFVIKIPFAYCSDDYLLGADCENGWDYCLAEVEKYEFARDNDIEQCFAETRPVGIVNNYPIYAQEYVTMYGHADASQSNHTPQDMDKMESLCEDKDYDCFNAGWLSDVLNFFGEKVFYLLMNFINDADINDLHSGNIGYIGMRPVLVDYSSFNN